MIYTDPSGEFISSFMYLGYKYLTRPALDNQNLNFSQFGQPTAQNNLEGLSYLVNSFISVPGIIPGGLSHAGIEVGFNGIGNLVSGNDFFDDWEIPAIYGFVSGAYSGYKLSDADGLNYWWGTDQSKWGYNRDQWSLAWWDEGRVLNYEATQLNDFLGEDMCVPSSFMMTHGEQNPRLSTANLAHARLENDNYGELYNELDQLHQNGFTKGHLRVENYGADLEPHRMALNQVRYRSKNFWGNESFVVKAFDPGLTRVFIVDGVTQYSVSLMRYNMKRSDFILNLFLLFNN